MPKTLEEIEREFSAGRNNAKRKPEASAPREAIPAPAREPAARQGFTPAPLREFASAAAPAIPAREEAFPKRQRSVELHEAPAPGKPHRVRELVFDLLVYGFALLLIAGSTMFAFSNNTEKSIFGYRFYQVLTPSMEPVFTTGDMIFIKICAPEEVQVGDIITFSPNRNAKAYLTHRAVEVRPGVNGEAPVIVTRGDANNTEDPPIAGTAVVGKYVFHIPVVGGVLQFIRENLLLMGICIGASFVLLIFLRSYFDARKQARE
jgi:signal peptidase I